MADVLQTTFSNTFPAWKSLHFDSSFSFQVSFEGTVETSKPALVQVINWRNRRQAINWINDDKIHWRRDMRHIGSDMITQSGLIKGPILGLRPDNKKRRYKVTPSLIGSVGANLESAL